MIKVHKKLMTKQGYLALQVKLQDLLHKDIPEVTNALSLAREKGDFSENGELAAAWTKKENLQNEAAKLHAAIGIIKPIDPPKIATIADIGIRVSIKCLNDPNRNKEYIIVGVGEQSIEKGSIAFTAEFVKSFLHQPVGFKFSYLKNNYEISGLSVPTDEELNKAIEINTTGM